MDASLPFFVTAPGDTDVLLGVIGVFLVCVLLGLGALYFTIQAIPERMAAGTHKIQMQIVGILGVISLFTMNNAFWIAALLLAAIPFHELVPAHWAKAKVDALTIAPEDIVSEITAPLEEVETALIEDVSDGEIRDA